MDLLVGPLKEPIVFKHARNPNGKMTFDKRTFSKKVSTKSHISLRSPKLKDKRLKNMTRAEMKKNTFLTQEHGSDNNSIVEEDSEGQQDSEMYSNILRSPKIDEESEEYNNSEMAQRKLKTEVSHPAKISKVPRLLLGSSILSRSHYAMTERNENSSALKKKSNKNGIFQNSGMFKKSSYRLLPLPKMPKISSRGKGKTKGKSKKVSSRMRSSKNMKSSFRSRNSK